LATRALSYAAAVGAEAIQVFVTNPRAWTPAAGNDHEARTLRERTASTGMPVFVHAPYLINVGSPDAAVRERSEKLLAYCVHRGREIAARGLVVHAGSAVSTDRASGLRRAREVLLPVLEALPDDAPDLLLEPMAGQGQMLCATVGEIGPYLAAPSTPMTAPMAAVHGATGTATSVRAFSASGRSGTCCTTPIPRAWRSSWRRPETKTGSARISPGSGGYADPLVRPRRWGRRAARTPVPASR